LDLSFSHLLLAINSRVQLYSHADDKIPYLHLQCSHQDFALGSPRALSAEK